MFVHIISLPSLFFLPKHVQMRLSPLPFENARPLGLTKNDAGFTGIVWRDLYFDLVPGNDPNEIFAHFPADVGQNPLTIGQGHPKHRVREHFAYNPFGDQWLLF
jgi:hypothetical protein